MPMKGHTPVPGPTMIMGVYSSGTVNIESFMKMFAYACETIESGYLSYYLKMSFRNLLVSPNLYYPPFISSTVKLMAILISSGLVRFELAIV